MGIAIAVVGALANHIGKFNGTTFAIGEGADGDARRRACSQKTKGTILRFKFYHFALLKTELRAWVFRSRWGLPKVLLWCSDRERLKL
jgi:hypothetical protein